MTESLLPKKSIYALFWGLIILFFAALGTGVSSCGVYKFNDASIPDSIRTATVPVIQNTAPYINAQLSPQLTEALRRKISNQSKIRVTNNEETADWNIAVTITDYSIVTSGISNQQSSQDRLTISLKIEVTDRRNPGSEPKVYDLSKAWEISANQSLQDAERSLQSIIIKTLSEDIFSRLFSNW